MTFTIIVGIVFFALFGKFAKRDSKDWNKTFERKGMKITRIILMCIWGIYVVAPLIALIFGWDKIRDSQKVSYVSYIMLGLSLFYYELTFRQSPRSIWVKIRKVFAYTLIGGLYIAIFPSTLLQFITGRVAGVYGNAIGTILISNTLIYGSSILIIWLLLKQYKRDKYVPYTKNGIEKSAETMELPSIDKNIQQNEILQNNHVTIASSIEIPQKQKPNLKLTKQVDGYVHRYLIYYVILVVIYLVFSSIGVIHGWCTGIMSIIGVLIFPSLLPIGLYKLISNMFDGRLNAGNSKKRLLAYFLIYEIILVVLTIILLILSEPDEPDTKGFFIQMTILALLSFLPIGITYIKQLLNENTAEQIDSGVHIEAPKKEKRKIQFNKKTLKWVLVCVLSILVIIGGITLYKYIHDDYFPRKKLDNAVLEIIEKFNNEETRTEYALYILEQNRRNDGGYEGHDWGYGSLNYKDSWIRGDYDPHLSYYESNGNYYINYYGLYGYREEAYDWIESQACQGNAECQYHLGMMYYNGDCYYIFKGTPYTIYENGYKKEVKCDKEKAAYWWLESAQNGYVRAFNNIGLCYMDGTGVKKDMHKAIEWLKKGAESGEPYAQLNYGDLFLNGVEIVTGSHTKKVPVSVYGYVYDWETEEVFHYTTLIPKDIEQAKYWWKKAAAQGNETAKERLQKIYN